jgi:thiol-disulfide isomerase/thioredoxin
VVDISQEKEENMKKVWILLFALVAGVFIYMKVVRTTSPVLGAMAPDFIYTDPTGQKHHLNEYRGSYVILHFWASWCGPCRLENQTLAPISKALQASYWDQLQIIHIGIESDSSRWAQAILDDKLEVGYHMSSLKKFNEPVAELYGVRSIPALFVLDRTGKVIAVNPEVKNLPKILTGR